MPAASILIKPASANCNMDCKYCFYKCLSSHREEYSKGFMKEETLETLVREAIAYADGSLTFAFQGVSQRWQGWIFFSKRQWNCSRNITIKKLQIENTIQTNGLLIDEKWARFSGRASFSGRVVAGWSKRKCMTGIARMPEDRIHLRGSCIPCSCWSSTRWTIM